MSSCYTCFIKAYDIYRNVNVIRSIINKTFTSLPSGDDINFLIRTLENMKNRIDSLVGECGFKNSESYVNVVKDNIDRMITALREGRIDHVLLENMYTCLKDSLDRFMMAGTIGWCMNAPLGEKIEVARSVVNITKRNIDRYVDQVERYLTKMYNGGQIIEI
ncbi:MAG: hypothetical protein GXO26_08000 [Crenarchaeota archaeon]|nr:hypothetical protein [Thermoproteota archaeon]